MNIGNLTINPKYRLKSFGKYTKAVYICPECDNDMVTTMYKNMKGFCSSSVGVLKVIECDKCFTNFSSHAMDFDYDLFLDTIEEGSNNFYT